MKTLAIVLFVILLASDVRAACYTPETARDAANSIGQRLTRMADTRYGETLRLYQNPDNGDWTLTVIRADGAGREIECTLVDGEKGWQAVGDPA